MSNSNISSTCPRNMVNFSPLMVERGWRFRAPQQISTSSRLGFITAPTSLNGGQRTFAGCLAVSWAGTLYYVHFRVLLYWQRYFAALEQRPSARLCNAVQGMELRNFRRGRHLYSAGRLSRSASAHILVVTVIAISREHFRVSLVCTVWISTARTVFNRSRAVTLEKHKRLKRICIMQTITSVAI